MATPSSSTGVASASAQNENTINKTDIPGSTVDNPLVIDSDPKPEFTLFPKLPLELRETIWKLAPEGRVIKVRTAVHDRGQIRSLREPRTSWDVVYKPRVNKSESPAILSTCKEARQAAKSIYRLSFEKELGGKKIWVDFSRDKMIFENTFTLLVFHGLLEDNPFARGVTFGELIKTLHGKRLPWRKS